MAEKAKEIVTNRHEMLFLYDVSFANPNGDPDENRPRMDEASGRNLVTDVRLKRTIRDYLHRYREYEIFVRDRYDDAGYLFDGKTTAKEFDNDENRILECIDIRLFGGTIPVTGTGAQDRSIIRTGPVQFNIGQSLHRVEVMHIKGTGAFASGKEKAQKTFREEYVVPYSMICFHGIVNENAAVETKMTKDDLSELFGGIWNGTKNLITRSKIGQVPRLLIIVEYKSENFHIGGLQSLLSITGKKQNGKTIEETTLRSPADYTLNITDLLARLESYSDNIETIWLRYNEDLQLDHPFESKTLSIQTLSFPGE